MHTCITATIPVTQTCNYFMLAAQVGEQSIILSVSVSLSVHPSVHPSTLGTTTTKFSVHAAYSHGLVLLWWQLQ